jgi:hypothetical protein
VRPLGVLTAAIFILGFAAYFLIFWPLRDPHPAVRLANGALAAGVLTAAEGRAVPGPSSAEEREQLLFQCHVETGQRFVQQSRGRPSEQSAGDGHPLSLAAGNLVWVAP